MARQEIDLSKLSKDDSIRVIANGDSGYTVDFRILEPGEQPLCEATMVDAKGTVTGPTLATLVGSGIWTTPEQNPVQRGVGRQRQDLALSISWGRVISGGILVVSDPSKKDSSRTYFEPKCDEIILNPNQSISPLDTARKQG